MKKKIRQTLALIFAVITVISTCSISAFAETITQPTAYPKLSFSSSVSSTSVYAGDTVFLAASALGGSGKYKYQYIYASPDDPDNFRWSIAQWETKSVEQKQLTQKGVYTFKITVQDSVTYEVAEQIHTIKVSAPPADPKLRISSGVAPNPAYINENITCSAAATSGSGNYEYAFYYKMPGQSQSYFFPGTSGFDSASTRSFTGTVKGKYQILCNVRDKNTGDIATSVHEIELKEKPMKCSGTIDRNAITIGDKVKLTSSATGSTGSYDFKITYSLDGGSAQTLQDFSSAKSYNFTPTKAGDYAIKFQARSSSGVTATNTVNLTVKNIQSTAKISKNSCFQGETIELTAGASGGNTPYVHRFEYEDSKGNKKVIADYGKSASQNFTANTPGTYYITILTKDAKNNVTSKSFKVDVKKYQPKATVKFNSEVLVIGNTFKVDIETSAGAEPFTYETYWSKPNGGSVKISDKASFSFLPTPTVVGDYKLKITVKDKYGNVALNAEEYTLSLIQNPYTRTDMTQKISEIEKHLKDQDLNDVISIVAKAAEDNKSDYIADIWDEHDGFENMTEDEEKRVKAFLNAYYIGKKALLDTNKSDFSTEYVKLSSTFSAIESLNFIQIENPSIMSVFASSIINNLNTMMNLVPAALSDGGKAFGLGLDFEWFANEYGGLFSVFATMFVVLFLAVNLLETTVQYELFTFKGGAKFAAKLVLCKVWVDLAVKICLLIAKIGNEMLASLISTATPNIDASHMISGLEAKSNIPVIGPIIDFLSGILGGSTAANLIILVLVILIFVMVLKVVIKLIIRTFEIGMITVISPIFFAAWVGEATKPYFKKFMSSLIGLVSEIVYMGLIYFIFMKWVEYTYSSLNGAELPLHLFGLTDAQTLTMAYLLVALAVMKMMYKPPEVIRNLFLR